TTSIIWPIAYRDRDGAWVASVIWSVTSTVTSTVTSIIRTGPVSSSVITAVIVGAPTRTERDRNYEEQDNLPFWSHSRSIPGGEGLHLRVINNVHFHIIEYGLDRAFTRLNSRTSVLG